MKSERGINNRWELLQDVLEIDIQRQFSPYGWYNNKDLCISKSEHWHGWWNECFDFIDIFPKSVEGKNVLRKIISVFSDYGYTIHTGLINGGISISYITMTKEELHEKSKRNLLAGGRMSD